MIWKIKIFIRFLQTFLNYYNKRKKERQYFERQEMESLIDFQNEIISMDNFKMTYYQGVRWNKELLSEFILEKNKKKTSILRWGMLKKYYLLPRMLLGAEVNYFGLKLF